MNKFRESDLALLVKPIEEFTPDEYYGHVKSLANLYNAKKKKASLSLAPKLRGKIIRTPKKNETGVYELRLTIQGTRAEFDYIKDKTVSQITFKKLVNALQCPESQLAEFLKIKKFTLAETPPTA